MWERACPHAMFLTRAGGVFETVPFDGTFRTDSLRRFNGGLANVTVTNVIWEEQLGHFGAFDTADFFNAK